MLCLLQIGPQVRAQLPNGLTSRPPNLRIRVLQSLPGTRVKPCQAVKPRFIEMGTGTTYKQQVQPFHIILLQLKRWSVAAWSRHEQASSEGTYSCRPATQHLNAAEDFYESYLTLPVQ